MFSDTIMTLSSCFTHQSSTTEENHKDNESLKPVVLNNLEAGFSKVPPLLSSPFFYTYLTALETPYTTFKTTYVLRKREILLMSLTLIAQWHSTTFPEDVLFSKNSIDFHLDDLFPLQRK